MDRLFTKQFTDVVKKEYMLERLARGFAGAGNLIDRQFMYMIGETACGKGVSTMLFQQAFGSYVETFNADSLLSTAGSREDPDKDLKWLLPIANSRMAISNEISFHTSTEETRFGTKKKVVGINADLVKRIVSGGDPLKARLLHANTVGSFIMKTNLCLYVNDLPTVNKVDDAYLNRANYITFDRSSKAGILVDNDDYFVADNTIKGFVSDEFTGDAFVDMMCEYYQNSVDVLMPKPDCVKHVSAEMSGASENGLEAWLTNKYNIHQNPKDLVDKKSGCVDWDAADGWFLQFDTLYSFYLEAGNIAVDENAARPELSIEMRMNVQFRNTSATYYPRRMNTVAVFNCNANPSSMTTNPCEIEIQAFEEGEMVEVGYYYAGTDTLATEITNNLIQINLYSIE